MDSRIHVGALLISIFWGVTSFANVCSKNPVIVAEVEKQLQKKCAQLTPSDLERVTDLDLRGMGISSLKEDDFQGFPSLKWIDLGGNDLLTLPENIFASTTLESIDIVYNHIANLPPKLFQYAPQLKAIILDGNPFAFIPAQLFKGLNKLEVISLGFGNFATLPEGLFSDS